MGVRAARLVEGRELRLAEAVVEEPLEQQRVVEGEELLESWRSQVQCALLGQQLMQEPQMGEVVVLADQEQLEEVVEPGTKQEQAGEEGEEPLG
jgi:hypothetical protein